MFEKSICDCCVCPMQFVLEQFRGEEVLVDSEFGVEFTIQITEVKNFIVSGIDKSPGSSGNPIHIAICNIVFISPLSTTRIPDVKPIQKNTKGECVCCEDPMTNVANALKGKEVISGASGNSLIIEKVGEGIVVGTFVSPPPVLGSTIIFSSCKIVRIAEITNPLLEKLNHWENLKQMSVNFAKSICDCCVSQMQFVLEQFRGEEVLIVPEFFGSFTIQITEVKNFIVSGLSSGNPIHIAICNIVSVSPLSTTRIPDVKPIQKNTKGECVCCEDPMTNVANTLKGKEVCISSPFPVIIEKVGEGIVVGTFVSSGSTIIFSSCKIGGIEVVANPLLEKLNHWENLKQMSVNFKKSICDCCVCPMQFALEQFKGEEVLIVSEFGTFTIQITEIKNFIVSGINRFPGDDPNLIHSAICNIVSVSPLSTTRIPDVKPIQKNTKGECVCCEDPMTNVANVLKGKNVSISRLSPVIIEKVGEGIVIGTFVSSVPPFGSTIIFSSCKIRGIEEITDGTLSLKETAQKCKH
ncbi:hypothetical protein [Chengkuizengella sediminis]|uniref:hypothetical protein n=1 Tax=Chengkuizengella sediminis TaxID=1885917 RepID=UPI001389DD0F|nr:hypothetical protein [Chengkuizengella sediminis]NDI33588.1 hypothetical protein [Chengkuizengella sediminis]